MDIGAVVLNFRNWPGVAETIRSLQAQTLMPRLVVVDNASGDGSARAIRDEFPDLAVIESSTNGGYAAGMNLGIQHLQAEATLLVTHEVLLAPDALAALASRLTCNVGAVGPLVFYRDQPEKVFSAGGFLRRTDFVVFHAHEKRPQPYEVEWLDGCCLLLRNGAATLDEGFFMYFEDADLGFALRKKGWTLTCEPTAHVWSQPSPLPTILFTRNRLRFLARNVGHHAVRQSIKRIVRDARVAASRGDLARSRDLLLGIAAYVLHLPGRSLR